MLSYMLSASALHSESCTPIEHSGRTGQKHKLTKGIAIRVLCRNEITVCGHKLMAAMTGRTA